MTLGMQIGLGPGYIVLDGDPAPLPQKEGRAPQFSAHVYCDQTVGWMRMALGMEVGLDPGHILLDGDSASPLQWPMSIVVKRLDGSRCHLGGR